MLRIFLFFSVLLTAETLHAYDVKSAHREPGESYLDHKYRAALFAEPNLSPLANSWATAQEAAVLYNAGQLPAAAAWESEAVLMSRFNSIRDYRWLQTPDRPGFLRRTSWLYPDDGCFARAALAIANLSQWSSVVPSKVFVFGNLSVRTPNSPSGWVNWWYHVAPIVQVKGQRYVLDPAVDPRGPLKLEDWLARMSPDIATLEVAVCGSGTYSPVDPCDKYSDGRESAALNDIPSYLGMEWSRMLELNRDPETALGQSPPWL